jgi:hypothetical protein
MMNVEQGMTNDEGKRRIRLLRHSTFLVYHSISIPIIFFFVSSARRETNPTGSGGRPRQGSNALPNAVFKTLFPFPSLVKGSNTHKGPRREEKVPTKWKKRIHNGYAPGQKGVLVKVGLSSRNGCSKPKGGS